MTQAVMIDAIRTPVGALGGSLASVRFISGGYEIRPASAIRSHPLHSPA